MLSDFQDFTVEPDVVTVDSVSSKIYEPIVESSCWFLSGDGESRDVLRMRAAHFYRRKEFDKAFDLYLRLLDMDHKPTYRFELLETAVRCGIRCDRRDQCVALLSELADLVKSPDQQFQFWHAAREVYRSMRSIDDWQRTLMLLLNDNDHNPHYWLELGETNVDSVASSANLRIGCTVRALELLKRTSATDCGFVKDSNQRLIESLSQTVLSFPENQVTSALVAVCSDILDSDQWASAVDSGEFSYRGDNESKVDSDRLLTVVEQQVVIENFKKRFSWLFS